MTEVHLREIALSRELGPEERATLMDYFADLIETGHSAREAITAIETVWADMA